MSNTPLVSWQARFGRGAVVALQAALLLAAEIGLAWAYTAFYHRESAWPLADFVLASALLVLVLWAAVFLHELGHWLGS